MVRPSYRANFTGDGGAPFFALVFDTASGSTGEPADLRGGFRARDASWDGRLSSASPDLKADVRPNKRIDTKLSTPLFDLPLGAIAAGTPPTSLAERNLLRHLTWRVPSGQSIAKRDGRPGPARRGSGRSQRAASTLRALDAALVLRLARG